MLRVTSDELRVVGYGLRVAGYELRGTGYELQGASYGYPLPGLFTKLEFFLSGIWDENV